MIRLRRRLARVSILLMIGLAGALGERASDQPNEPVGATPASPPPAIGSAPRQYKGKFDSIGPFRYQDLDGRAWTENDFKGKFLIVEQWAAWCRPCIDNFPRVEELKKAISGDPSVALVSFNLDGNVSRLGEFLAEFRKEYSVPVLFAGAQLKILSLPRTLIVDKQGYIREDFVGEGDSYVNTVVRLVDVVKRAPPIAELPADVVKQQREVNARDAARSR